MKAKEILKIIGMQILYYTYCQTSEIYSFALSVIITDKHYLLQGVICSTGTADNYVDY